MIYLMCGLLMFLSETSAISWAAAETPQVAATLTPEGGGEQVEPEDPEVMKLLMQELQGAVLDTFKNLKQEDPAARRMAVEDLAAISQIFPDQNSAILVAFKEALKDSDAGVRLAAALAFTQFDPSQVSTAVPILLNLYQEVSGEVRAKILSALRAMDFNTALHLAHQAVKDRDTEVRMEALAVFGDPQAASEAKIFQIMAEAGRDPVAEVRRTAVAWLGSMKHPQVLSLLAQALEDPAGDVRQSAMVALARLSPASLPILSQALTHRDAAVRTSAVNALVAADRPEVADQLIARLNDTDLLVRLAAVKGLARSPDLQKRLALTLALADSDYNVRALAFESFVQSSLKGSAALSAFLPMLHLQETEELDRTLQRLVTLSLFDPSSLPVLVQFFKETSDSRKRDKILFVATSFKHPSTLFMITLALKDSDERLRQHAIQALGQPWLGILSVVPILAPFLKDPEPVVRQRALVTMANINDPLIVPFLIQGLLDQELWVRVMSAAALAPYRQEPGVSTALKKAAQDSSADVREAARSALEPPRHPNLITHPELKQAVLQLTHQESAKRQAAVQLIASIKNEDSLPWLTEALKSQDDVIQQQAFQGFRQLQVPTVPGIGLRNLGNPLRGLRMLAVQIARHEGPAGYSALRMAIQDMDWFVAQEAVSALLFSGEDLEEFPELARLVEDPLTPRSFRQLILQRFQQLRQAQLPSWLAKIIRNARESMFMRIWALPILGATQDEAALPTLIEALQNTEEGISPAALQALGRMGSAALPVFKERLRHPDPDIRALAFKALDQMGPEAMPLLMTLLEDLHSEFRGMAASTISRFRDVSTIPALARAAQDHRVAVRRSAVQALAAMQDLLTVSALRTAMKDLDPEVFGAARRGLEHLGEIEVPLLKKRLR